MTAGAAGITLVHAVGAAGRLRVDVPQICNRPDRAAALEELLAVLLGMRRVAARPVTGSLLLHIDPGPDQAATLALVAEAVAATRSAPSPPSGPVPSPGRTAQPAAWWHMSPEAVIEDLDAHAERGLAPDDALARLARHGPNVRPREAPSFQLAVLARQFSGLPVKMLASSATVSLFGGGVSDAVATLAVVVVNAVLGYVTEHLAEKVIGALTGSAKMPAAVMRGWWRPRG